METERVGFTGIAPPEAGDPSLPAVGRRVFNVGDGNDTLYLYSDGRIIWHQYNHVEPGDEDWIDLAPEGADIYETGWL